MCDAKRRVRFAPESGHHVSGGAYEITANASVNLAFSLPESLDLLLRVMAATEQTMAQLARTGSSCASLYECETTLAQVFSELGLRPLSASEETEIRSRFGEVIGRALMKIEVTEKLSPDAKLKTKQIAGMLRAIARDFQAHEPLLRGAQDGIRQSHEIEVANRIRRTLRSNPEVRIDPDQFLNDSCERLKTISEACLVAARYLESAKSEAGRKAIDWFDDYTRTLVWIAEKNGIRAKLVNDRSADIPAGRFFDIALGMERVLDPAMRAPSREALGKRVSRSLSRLSVLTDS